MARREFKKGSKDSSYLLKSIEHPIHDLQIDKKSLAVISNGSTPHTDRTSNLTMFRPELKNKWRQIKSSIEDVCSDDTLKDESFFNYYFDYMKLLKGSAIYHLLTILT